MQNQVYGQDYGQGYEQDYGQGYPNAACPPCESSIFDIIINPIGFLRNKAICMAIGIVVFMLLMFAISKIPIVGPWVSNTIKLIITKLAVFAGVLNCGFENEFDKILDMEKNT